MSDPSYSVQYVSESRRNKDLSIMNVTTFHSIYNLLS